MDGAPTMASSDGLEPIFVHASARSGSTYFFNVLRRNSSLLCFNEAIMDQKRDVRNRNRDVAKPELVARNFDLNHRFLERADFDEFIEAWDAAMHLCPEFPELQDYLSSGILSADLANYLAALMNYARLHGKRPVLCEINSRGRAGALRKTFGGFHITQYRNPLSQFGSFIRALVEGGTWAFLAFPAMELGTSSAHPLYCVVPEAWRPPTLPWRIGSRAQHWASKMRYFAAIASPQPEIIENVFRWHMFSWVLSNLAALSYSDFALDIDTLHDDAEYRACVVHDLTAQLGVTLDLSDIEKFDRYYEFEAFDVASVCNQVIATTRSALADGHLEAALWSLGAEHPTISPETGVDLLLSKIEHSLELMAASSSARRPMSAAEWKALVKKNRRIWFNPGVRWVAQRTYPAAARVVWMARRTGLPI
jgi:hypothetical protein